MRHQRCLQHASVLAATAAAVLAVTAACTVSSGAPSHGPASPASPRPAAPASAPPELGVFEPGEWASYQPVARFAAETGQRPSIVLIYSGWPEPFQARFAAMVHAHHAEPFVQMEPVGASLAAIAAGKYDRYLETDRKSTRLNSSHSQISY